MNLEYNFSLLFCERGYLGYYNYISNLKLSVCGVWCQIFDLGLGSHLRQKTGNLSSFYSIK